MDRDGEPSSAYPPVRRRPWPRRRVAITYAAGLVALAAAVVGIRTHAELDHTEASLASVRAEVHRAIEHLAGTRSQLSAVKGESDSAQRVLASDAAQLSDDQAGLAYAEADIVAKGVNISDLDTCLSGVEQALNQISLGDQNGAAVTLSGASASCDGAEPTGS